MNMTVEPKIEYKQPALDFLDSAGVQVAADIIRIAVELFFEPELNGTTKTLKQVGRAGLGYLFRKTYQDERYWVYYDQEDDDLDDEWFLLVIYDAGLVPQAPMM